MTGAISRIFDEYEHGRVSRREAMVQIGLLVAMLSGGRALASGEEASESTFRAVGLDHVALRVTDIDRSVEFYREHLGLKVLSRGDRSSFLDCGSGDFVALFRAEEAGLHHYCYAIEGYRPGQAVKTLQAAGLEPRRHENRVYFDDPDGLTVQVSGR